MPETPLADQGKPFHSDRVDIIGPNAFELVQMQRIPKKTTEWLIEAARCARRSGKNRGVSPSKPLTTDG